jgi:hypothetical protein
MGFNWLPAETIQTFLGDVRRQRRKEDLKMLYSCVRYNIVGNVLPAQLSWYEIVSVRKLAKFWKISHKGLYYDIVMATNKYTVPGQLARTRGNSI